MRTANGWKLGIIAASVSLALGAQAQQAEKDQQRSQSAQQQQQQGSQAQRSQSGQSQQQVRQSSESMTFDKLAEQHSNLTEFANAVKAAGLDDSLADGTEYTIFAPTNQAFDAKQGTSIDELMKPENHDDLVKLLRAHIVADDLDLATARELPAAKTIDGGQVDLRTQNGMLMVGDARLAEKNGIEMGNIRIFPIDGVLAKSSSGGSSPQASNRNEETSGKTQSNRND